MPSQENVMPKYTGVGEGIYAIDTEYVRPLMDASHLIVDNGRAAYVDTGTTLSVPNLLASLEDIGLTTADVDAVFLTHIHLDHAGGAGALMQHLPNATATYIRVARLICMNRRNSSQAPSRFMVKRCTTPCMEKLYP